MTTTAALVVDLVDLPRRVGAVKDVSIETAAPADLGIGVIGVREGTPIALDAQVTALDNGVLVRGNADVHVHGQCVRCLRDLDEDRAVTFDELYYLPQAVEAQRAEGDEEAEDVFLIDSDAIDLELALRDALVLALPFQPLCREDCAGLCPDCGERLDDLPADHHHEQLDPRWSALAALLPDQDPSARGGTTETETADTGAGGVDGPSEGAQA